MATVVNSKSMQIFRAADAPRLMEAGVLDVLPFDAQQRAGMDVMVKAGVLEGDEGRVLFNAPGFSLVHIWFKRNYPLVLHSHNCDCLYYIVAGSLKLGTEELGRGDGFFIPAGAPYKYTPGDVGVEVLEFRHETHFDLRNLSKGSFYEKAAETVAANVENWRHAKRPSEL